jgi:hypothetical protein
MKQLLFLSGFFLLVFLVLPGCRKDPPDNFTFSQDLMDYFINYDVGTCWVYEDSLQPSLFDTISLTNKGLFKEADDRTSIFQKEHVYGNEFVLGYHSVAMDEDFAMYIQSSGPGNYSFSLSDAPYGTIEAECYQDKWDGFVFGDSIEVNKKVYKRPLYLRGYVGYMSDPVYASKLGLISYKSSKGNHFRYFRFVKTFRK